MLAHERGQKLDDEQARLRIERTRRLVCEDDARPVDEGSCERGALRLAAADRSGKPVATGEQPEALEPRIRLRARLPPPITFSRSGRSGTNMPDWKTNPNASRRSALRSRSEISWMRLPS